MAKKNLKRCEWSGDVHESYLAYHDEEWGVPVHDDRKQFEFLILEGAQAGLSWETILKKRDTYRAAFDNFDAAVVARYGKRKVKLLLADAGIVRNRLKVTSSIENAKCFLKVQDEFDSFDKYIWQFVDGRTKVNRFRSMKQIPVSTPQSDSMSRELKQRGFNFVGTTICYAFMQAVGMVNDHTTGCFRYKPLVEMA